jgi:hypothetical protein
MIIIINLWRTKPRSIADYGHSRKRLWLPGLRLQKTGIDALWPPPFLPFSL